MENKKAKEREIIFFILVSVFMLFALLVFPSIKVLATSSTSGNGFNLTLWDDTDTTIKKSLWETFFYANFTNASDGNPVLDGNCTLRFNYTGAWGNWVNTTYNSTYNRFQYNSTSINYKGIHLFEVNCTNSSLNISLTDSFNITNSVPSISKESGGDWIDFDGNNLNHDSWQCTEDTICYYNFTSNITENDDNDVLSYSTGNAENITLTNYTLDTVSGMLTINVTESNRTGTGKKIELRVQDTESLQQNALLEVDIAEANDAPIFTNMENRSFNMSELFEYIIYATDEENNIPFTFNITFLSCSTAVWSDRNSTNCTLFSESQYSTNGSAGAINISFTPLKNDVGTYIINFTVTDLNNNVTPYNQSTSQVVNFTVLNVNSAPYFVYVCDNERIAEEDSSFACTINASDIDESRNLTFSSNYTWFLSNINASPLNEDSPYNFTIAVNFTADDSRVGNWLINVSIQDNSESPIKVNYSLIYFNVTNINDSISLEFVDNFTAYENTTYQIQINATDNDLLIPDKSVYDENLTFFVNVSWVDIVQYATTGNKTTAYLNFTGNTDYQGNNSITLSVNDSNGFSSDSQVFVITIFANNPPQWNSSLNLSQNASEDVNFNLNLSQYITDQDVEDTITYVYTNLSYFSSFTLNLTTGVINFTPSDYDIGFHQVIINASDSKVITAKTMNFTINNTNDVPVFGSYPDQSAVEDNSTTLDVLWIYDNDFLIPQKSAPYGYNESLNLTIIIQGPNSSLFTFTEISQINNYTRYSATFTPVNLDIGSYNITLNVTDRKNSSTVLIFNLTVSSEDDDPVLVSVDNQTTPVGGTFYLDINATDEEDGNDQSDGSGNLTFSIVNISGQLFFTINSSTGLINSSVVAANTGVHEYNISVNDTSGNLDFQIFKLTVYGAPYIVNATPSGIINTAENQTVNITVIANHTVQDDLNFSWYFEGILRNSSFGPGNGSDFHIWEFALNFTDETFNSTGNLTLIVSNAELSNSTFWNVTVNHTNYPVEFLTTIQNQSAGGAITLTLSSYFADQDASDSRINQTVSFEHVLINCTNFNQNLSSGTISVLIINWTNASTPIINYSSSVSATECFRILAYDLNDSGVKQTNATSNNFSVTINPSMETPPPEVSSGGGGVAKNPVAIKIIMPDPVSAYSKQKIILPIKLQNTGTISFRNINLTGAINIDSKLIKDILISFDKQFFSSLDAGEEQEITMTIDVNTDEPGLYEITLNASAESPVYSDWGKLYLTVKEGNTSEFKELIIFAEELIVSNPECIELTELIKESETLSEQGDVSGAIAKTNEAIEACKYALYQRSKPTMLEQVQNKMFFYFMISVIAAFVYMVFFYIFKKWLLKGERFNKT